jgi:hypothetical protein
MDSRKLMLRGLVGGAILGAVCRLLLNLFLQIHWGWEEIAIGAATGAALGIASGSARARRERRYAEGLGELAREAGFTHTPEPGEVPLLRQFPLLGLGTLLSARHHLARHDERLPVEMLDLDLGEDDVQLSVMTLILFRGGAAGLPDFWLHPRRPDPGLPGGPGITLDVPADDPNAGTVGRFRKDYRLDPDITTLLRSSEEITPKAGVKVICSGWLAPLPLGNEEIALDPACLERICGVFSLDALRFFADNPGWHVQAHGGHLALWRGEGVVPADDRPALLVDALRVQEILNAGPAAGRVVFPGTYRIVPRRPSAAVEVVKGVVLGLFLGWLLWLFLTCAVMAAWAPGRAGAWLAVVSLIAVPLLAGVVGGRLSYRRCQASRAKQNPRQVSRAPVP